MSETGPKLLSPGTPGQALVRHTPLSVTTAHLAAQLTPHTATFSSPVGPDPRPAPGPSPSPPALSSPQELTRSPQPEQKCQLSSFRLQERAGVPALTLTAPPPQLHGPGRSEQVAHTRTLSPPRLSGARPIKNTGGAGGNRGGARGRGKGEGVWPDGAGHRGHVARHAPT